MNYLPIDTIEESLANLSLGELYKLQEKSVTFLSLFRREARARSNTYEPYLLAITLDDPDMLEALLRQPHQNINLRYIANIAIGSEAEKVLERLIDLAGDKIDPELFEYVDFRKISRLALNPKLYQMFIEWGLIREDFDPLQDVQEDVPDNGEDLFEGNQSLYYSRFTSPDSFYQYLNSLRDPGNVDEYVILTGNLEQLVDDVVHVNREYIGDYTLLSSEVHELNLDVLERMLIDKISFSQRELVFEAFRSLLYECREWFVSLIVENIREFMALPTILHFDDFIVEIVGCSGNDMDGRRVLDALVNGFGYIPLKMYQSLLENYEYEPATFDLELYRNYVR